MDVQFLPRPETTCRARCCELASVVPGLPKCPQPWHAPIPRWGLRGHRAAADISTSMSSLVAIERVCMYVGNTGNTLHGWWKRAGSWLG